MFQKGNNMKTKTAVLFCLAAIMILALSGMPNWAKAEPGSSSGSKIGVLSVRIIFEKCKRNDIYRETMAAEQDKAIAELEKMKADIEAERVGLKTLKTGSSEYLTQMKQILAKQANYTAMQEFHKQQMALKEQQWIERLYKDVVSITADVAREKGLDLIIENSEPELLDTTAEGLVMSIRTHKVLYGAGCVDITNEVMDRLDAKK